MIPVFNPNPSRHLLLSTAAASFIALASFAAEPPAPLPGSTEYSHQSAPDGRAAHSLGRVQRARDLVGMEVRNYQSQRLGKVEDLVLDFESGRIVQVLLVSGGFLGLGESLRSVAPDGFHHDVDNRILHLDLTQEAIKAMAVIDASNWKACCTSNRLVEVSRSADAIGADAPKETRVTARIPSEQAMSLQKATQMLGLSVVNGQAEALGKVENMMMDLAAGRIVAVIISSGGFLGLGDELSAVPPAALRFNEDQTALRLDTTKESLASAPHFKTGEWPDFSQRAYSVGVYNAYHVTPYFGTNTVTDDGASVKPGSALTPLDQGTSASDGATTAQIRRDIISGEGRSFSARNVKIITIDGRVTLRGPVNTAAEKSEIGAIAVNIAKLENVDNQLEVK
ncbi:MAG: hypothetical protein RIS76_4588 [Verrucomicrobiota bacterium]